MSNLPIKRTVKPIEIIVKDFIDLCLLYPKHRLHMPIKKEVIKNIHSVYSFTNKDKKNVGKNMTKIGSMAQWTAQSNEATIPKLSNLFI